MWNPFRRRSPPRLEAVPEPSDTEGDALEDEVEDLRRKVNGLRFDVDDLTERFTRREGRDAKRTAREAGPPAVGGQRGAPAPRNGLPSLASLRAQGRNPFGN